MAQLGMFAGKRIILFAFFAILSVTIYISLLLMDCTTEHQQNMKNYPLWTGGGCPTNSIVTNMDCDCARAERRFPFPKEQSSCDYYSTARGSHQKVVSFAFYGDTSSVYFQGVEQSVINVAHRYPDWIMRLYHNINTSDRKQHLDLCNLWCKYEHLDLCDAKNLPFPLCDQSKVYGTLWRFFPMGDPLVDIFLVRDIDSPIITREIDAVQDWIRRNKTFHIMRDHPYHGVPILAGMWGALNGNRSSMADLRRRFILNGLEWVHGKDQNLLSEIVWPHAAQDSVAHDSYTCNNYPDSIPFPTRRDNLTYVGMIYGWRENQKHPLEKPCPEKCRPSEHPDWEYC